MATSTKLVDRVRKLLAMGVVPEGADEATRNEADSAARMARQIMQEHAISLADVEASERPPDPIVAQDCRFVDLTMQAVLPGSEYDDAYYERPSLWKKKLASTVADYLDIHGALRPNRNEFIFYGHASDVDLAQSLYGILAEQIDARCKIYLREARIEAGEAWGYWDAGIAKTKGTDFRISAIVALDSRFAELKREEEVTSGTGLMVQRKAEVDAWVNERFTFKSIALGADRKHNSEGYKAGRELKLSRSTAELPNKSHKRLETQ